MVPANSYGVQHNSMLYWICAYHRTQLCLPVCINSSLHCHFCIFFTARRYAQSLWLPGVCLSVTLVHSIQTAEDIVKLLCGPGSLIILVLWLPAPILNSKGNPFIRGTKYKAWENFAIFDWNCHLSWKRYKIGPSLLWNVNRKSYMLYWMVTFSMTLTNPNQVFKVTVFFKSNISYGQSYTQSIEWYH